MSDKFIETVNWANNKENSNNNKGVNWFLTAIVFFIIAVVCLYVWFNYSPKRASRQMSKTHQPTGLNTFADMKRGVHNLNA